jgi:probable phosphoglycerate mutase
MNPNLPAIYLARHGETAWTVTGQHTGLTDLPLTERGERNARQLGARLQEIEYARVFVSPLQRARQTCELAGFAARAEIDADLVEWNYGQYEGKTTAEIRKTRPDWDIFRDGCPEGETAEDVGRRADRVVAKVRAVNANVLLFSSAHFLRVLGARWIGMPPDGGRYFYLGTASLSIVGYDHNRDEPTVRLWNCTGHVTRS